MGRGRCCLGWRSKVVSSGAWGGKGSIRSKCDQDWSLIDVSISWHGGAALRSSASCAKRRPAGKLALQFGHLGKGDGRGKVEERRSIGEDATHMKT